MKLFLVSLLMVVPHAIPCTSECGSSLTDTLQKYADAVESMCHTYSCPSSNRLDSLSDKISRNQESILEIRESINNLTRTIESVMGEVRNRTCTCKEDDPEDPDPPVVESPCGIDGQWTRVGYLNMNDSSQECPSGFRLYEENGVRACGRTTTSGGSCHSVALPYNGNSGYTEICGKVIGFQYTLPDAVWSGGGGGHNDLNSFYVDGVSITRGSPRKHVWTFMAGRSESQDGGAHCPCNTGNSVSVQSFIGDDYFCESSVFVNDFTPKFYTHEPLWDGNDCSTNEIACCAAPGLPWFHKVLGASTTDDLELRVCADESTSGEDSPVNYYEIYVK